MKKYNDYTSQLVSESVDTILSDKAKLSLYKKSLNSDIPVSILEEVYRRGYTIWNEQFGGTPEQFAFDRVNSFIAGGFAAQLDEDLLDEKRGLWDNIHAKRARIKAGSGERMRKPGSKGAPTDAALKASQNEDADPCWKGYKQVGMKMKSGRKVPNCVPVKEQLDKPTPSEKTLDKKYGKSVTTKALKQGEKVEKEHTSNSKIAREIARDHLGEKPNYYKKLKQVDEGKVKDTLQKVAKVGALVGALGAHAGKVYDVGNVATHSDDPGMAAATIASYAHPASRVFQAAPSILKVDKLNKGENEPERQKKYPKKTVKEDAEAHSKDSKKPSSRFIGSNELTDIYKKQTPGQIVMGVVREKLEEDWQDKKYKNPSGGLTKAGVMAFRRENPGSKLQTAVTTPPSKLKPGSKAANRRKSFCARMGGMKKRLTSAKTANDPDSRINKALRKWNCEETIHELSVPAGTTGKRKTVSTPMVAVRMASGKIEKHPPGKSGSSGGGGNGGE